jgi:hypothetical protein
LPKASGEELVERLRAHPTLRAVPVVLLGAPGALPPPEASQAQQVLPKPVDFDRLLAVAARFCRRDAPPRGGAPDAPKN